MQSARTCEDKMSRPRTIQGELKGRTGPGRLLPATKEDEKRTKILGIQGGCGKDILEGDEGE